jgi:hypothetical protein
MFQESADPMDFFLQFDQKDHLDRLMGDCADETSEKDGELRWIFQDMDYSKWKHDLRTLVLSAPAERSHELTQAAYYIVHELQDIDADTVPLYFFSQAVNGRPLANSKTLKEHEKQIAVSLATLLRQLINVPVFPKAIQNSILRAFLDELRACWKNRNTPTARAPGQADPILLMQLATLPELWGAFDKAFGIALRNWPKSDTVGSRNPNLTFIFDLDCPPIETWTALLDSMRTLQRHFPTVKWLVTNPPERGRLELLASEVHLEFDKERQGFPPEVAVLFLPEWR